MSEMVERVAKAAYESLFLGSWPDDVGTSIDADGFRRAARAAIAAMREPTSDALEAGCMAGTNLTTSGPSFRLGNRTAGERMADQWKAMIDAALKLTTPRNPKHSRAGEKIWI